MTLGVVNQASWPIAMISQTSLLSLVLLFQYHILNTAFLSTSNPSIYFFPPQTISASCVVFIISVLYSLDLLYVYMYFLKAIFWQFSLSFIMNSPNLI